MSPYTPSACPVCRTKYNQLPAICAKLHHYLATQFPEQYAARRQETEAEERDLHSTTPEPSPAPCPLPSGPDGWTPQHFACDSPACGKLLCRPLVLTCGHVIDAACMPRVGDSDGTDGHALHTSECPACGLVSQQQPAACRQLGELVTQLFPEQSRQRLLECEHELAAEIPGRQLVPGPQAQAQKGQQPPVSVQASEGLVGGSVYPSTPRASAAGSAADGSGATTGDEGTAGDAAGRRQQQQQQQQALSPSLTLALRRRQEAGGASQLMADRLEANLQRLSGDSYVHHAVGCDGCGAYPIQGRRYKCQDCPEAMGFDLCGACMDRGLGNVVGRFNQRHLPEHRMHLCRPRVTAMHLLQAANPELPMEQLMWLLELTLTGGDEEAGQEQEATQPAQQQQQQQQPASGISGDAAVNHSGTDANAAVTTLRRGPRPVFDATAQEPSPSAHAAAAGGPGTAGDAAAAAAAAAGSDGTQELGGEAQGLIDDGEEEVHVALADLERDS
ncbi:hypothetical protein D9Q98_003329 [Chlorella vulgaris]|uniref:ZZ-type domain-containing protein n=1 Tax=Chlorella vulgaris TaxID=3077 RepID=A0A9D4YYV0_CHLVU|nr:hypothetical protein D9Q98_003329 [Chlorella vulgaris]